MITLGAADVTRILPMRDAIDVAAHAFAAISARAGEYPQRTHVTLAVGDALVMPGYDGGQYFGTKVVTVHPGNRAQNEAVTKATYLLLDATDGELLLVCDGTSLTALRTGAASGLATRRLARADARRLAIFGAGGQAVTQLDAILAVRAIEEVRVVGRDSAREAEFVAAAQRRYPKVRVERSNARAALDGADVVVTATNSTSPVFDGAQVAPGTHVNAIGAYRLDMRELDAWLLRHARVVVDQREAALAEAGDLAGAVADGALAAAAIAELGELPEDARTGAFEITVFKSVGHAALDLFTALELFRRARESGGESA